MAHRPWLLTILSKRSRVYRSATVRRTRVIPEAVAGADDRTMASLSLPSADWFSVTNSSEPSPSKGIDTPGSAARGDGSRPGRRTTDTTQMGAGEPIYRLILILVSETRHSEDPQAAIRHVIDVLQPLQESLNAVWNTQPSPGITGGVLHMVRATFQAAMTLGT